MAWGSWSSSKWQKVWSNGYYQQDIEWSYRHDVVNKKVEYRATRWRIKKISSSVTGWWKSSCPVGLGVITATRKTTNANVDTRSGNYVTVDITDDSRSVGLKSDGSPDATELNLHAYCDAASTGATGAPSGWKVYDIIDQIPKVDISGGTASASVSSKTYNSITISYTSNVATTLIQYSLNGGAWTDTGKDLGTTGGGTTSFTIGGLSPNTAYTIKVRHRRDYTQAYSNEVSLSATTNKPSAPSGGTVSVSEITHKSAKMTYSGFKAGAGASIARYDVAMRPEPGDTPWVNNDLNTNYTKTGLSPNTKCIAKVRAVDNYGQYSAVKDYSFTTLKPPAPTGGKITVGEITTTSIAISYSEFTLGDMASLSKYEVACYSSGSPSYISNGTNTSYVFNNLSPNTEYTIAVRLTDNYGQTRTVTTKAKTLEDQAKIFVKNNGVWVKGKVFVKHEGAWVKAKGVFVKKDGTWVKSS